MSLYQASIVGKDKHISILTAELQQLKQVLPTLNHDNKNNHNHNNNHDDHNHNNKNKHMKISGEGQRKGRRGQGRQGQGLYDDGSLK